VQLPTTSKGHGIPKSVVQGVFLAESLTNKVNGYSITSIVNTLEEDITIYLPQVELEEVDIDPDDSFLFSNSLVEDNDRLSKLRHELRIEHLNSEERVLLMKICEEYNDIPFGRRPTDFYYSSRAHHPHPNNRPYAGNKHKTLRNN
jgi:hypothetical protein